MSGLDETPDASVSEKPSDTNSAQQVTVTTGALIGELITKSDEISFWDNPNRYIENMMDKIQEATFRDLDRGGDGLGNRRPQEPTARYNIVETINKLRALNKDEPI